MSQNALATIDPNDMSGTELAAWLESFKANIYSGHRGAARPDYVVAGMTWARSINSTAEEIYYYDGAGDILLGTFNPTDHTLVAKLLKSLDPGAAFGPDLLLDRASPSPQANDILGAVRWGMRNASAAQVIAALDTAEILNVTAGAEAARRLFQVVIAGALSTRMLLGQGLYMPGATGGDPGADKINAAGFYKNGVEIGQGSPVLPKRQTVSAAAVNSNGAANFISAGSGLAVNIAAAAVPIVLTAANGFGANGEVDRVGVVAADTAITGLTANTTNYLYADIDAAGAVTFGKTTVAPAYQESGTYSTTANQFTFNVAEMVGKVGNGSVASQVYRVFIGEAVTGASTVTSVVNYALNGRYVGAWTATLPGTGQSIAINHNLGTTHICADIGLEALCTTAELAHAVGDILTNPLTDMSTGYAASPHPRRITSRNALVFTTGDSAAWMTNSKTAGGADAVMTAANWSYRTRLVRGW